MAEGDSSAPSSVVTALGGLSESFCNRCLMRLEGRRDTAACRLITPLQPPHHDDDEDLQLPLCVCPDDATASGGYCGLCFGLMHLDASAAFQRALLSAIRRERYEDVHEASLLLTLPPNALFRQYVVKTFLESRHWEARRVVDLKEAVRWIVETTATSCWKGAFRNDADEGSCMPRDGFTLSAGGEGESALRVSVTFGHSGAEDELKDHFRSTAVGRKDRPSSGGGRGRGRKRKAVIKGVSLATLQKELGHRSASELLEFLGLQQESTDGGPGRGVEVWRTLLARVTDGAELAAIDMERDSIFITGRYLKLTRRLSQTAWFVEGQKKTASSVEEVIGLPLQEAFRAKTFKFHASGREDVDVRMLGNGRPFIVELLNPRRTYPPADITLSSLEAAINAHQVAVQRCGGSLQEDDDGDDNGDDTGEDKDAMAASGDATADVTADGGPSEVVSGLVQVREMRRADKRLMMHMQRASEEKQKVYACVVWTEKAITPTSLQRLRDAAPLTVQQKTPLRVLHRRSAAVRPKAIHWMEAEYINGHFFALRVCTQAGTYVKELVHGDLGRTHPSVRSLLDSPSDILQLDVLRLVDDEGGERQPGEGGEAALED